MMLHRALCFDFLGPLIDNEKVKNGLIKTDLQYNEFVVYDVGQVQIRYAVRVKFHFKGA